MAAEVLRGWINAKDEYTVDDLGKHLIEHSIEKVVISRLPCRPFAGGDDADIGRLDWGCRR